MRGREERNDEDEEREVEGGRGTKVGAAGALSREGRGP